MRKSLFIVLCCLAVACQREQTNKNKVTRVTTKTIPSDARNARIDTVIQPAPILLDRALIGTSVGPDGNVTKDATNAKKGEKVYLTLFLHDSPVGLHTKVVWTDAKKKQISHEEREMKGAKVVTYVFDTSKVKPGVYRAEGYWGGNLATVKDFDVK